MLPYILNSKIFLAVETNLRSLNIRKVLKAGTPHKNIRIRILVPISHPTKNVGSLRAIALDLFLQIFNSFD